MALSLRAAVAPEVEQVFLSTRHKPGGSTPGFFC